MSVWEVPDEGRSIPRTGLSTFSTPHNTVLGRLYVLSSHLLSLFLFYLCNVVYEIYSVRPICLPWTRKLLAHIFSDIIYMESRCFRARLNRGSRNKTWLLVILAVPPHLINWSTHWILKSPTHWILKSPTHWSPHPLNPVVTHPLPMMFNLFLFNFKPLIQNYNLFAW
jgi:hypothetical protein